MRVTIDTAPREQHGERNDDCEMDQRREEERGLHSQRSALNFSAPERVPTTLGEGRQRCGQVLFASWGSRHPRVPAYFGALPPQK